LFIWVIKSRSSFEADTFDATRKETSSRKAALQDMATKGIGKVVVVVREGKEREGVEVRYK